MSPKAKTNFILRLLHFLLHAFDYFLRVLGVIFLVILIGLGYGGFWLWKQLPTSASLHECMTTKMYEVKLCPDSAEFIKLDQISPYLVKTIVLTEDSKFWDHKGFDFESLEKNAQEVLETGKYKRGGSTITQQLVKNLYLSGEKSLLRKGIEALITYQIERKLSKREILERYLNVIEFGKGLYGIKAASQFYFKKPAKDLNVLESAFLAMLLPNPEKYSRSFFKKELTPFARDRVERIVSDLYQYQRITDAEFRSAKLQVNKFLLGGSLLVLPQFQSLQNEGHSTAVDSSAGAPQDDLQIVTPEDGPQDESM